MTQRRRCGAEWGFSRSIEIHLRNAELMPPLYGLMSLWLRNDVAGENGVVHGTHMASLTVLNGVLTVRNGVARTNKGVVVVRVGFVGTEWYYHSTG